jgi:hypothetical protein
MTTIDEQIAYAQQLVNDGKYPEYARGIFASLERLKAIDSVQVPERELIPECSYCGLTQAVTLKSYDTLRDLLRRESARADYNGGEWAKSAEGIVALQSKLAAIEKMGREPSEGMVEAGYAATNQDDRYCVEDCDDAKGLFTAMFAKLVEQAGVKK